MLNQTQWRHWGIMLKQTLSWSMGIVLNQTLGLQDCVEPYSGASVGDYGETDCAWLNGDYVEQDSGSLRLC